MPRSPQRKTDISGQDIIKEYELSRRPSEAEIAANIDSERAEALHRRKLEYVGVALMFVVSVFSVYMISTTRQPDDSSRSAWTMLSTIVSAVAGYIAGRKTK